MILNIKNLKTPHHKLLKLIQQGSRIQRLTYKNWLHFFTPTMKFQKWNVKNKKTKQYLLKSYHQN